MIVLGVLLYSGRRCRRIGRDTLPGGPRRRPSPVSGLIWTPVLWGACDQSDQNTAVTRCRPHSVPSPAGNICSFVHVRDLIIRALPSS